MFERHGAMTQGSRFGLLLAVAVLGAAIAGCKAKRSESGIEGLNDGREVGKFGPSMEEMKDGRDLVVIYYANDTYGPRTDKSAAQNRDALMKILEHGADHYRKKEAPEPKKAKKLQGIRDQIEADWNDFRDSATKDESALTKLICGNQTAPYKDSLAGLVVMRNSKNDPNTCNRFGRAERCLVMKVCEVGDQNSNATDPDSRMVRVRPFDFPYDSQPLSHIEVLQETLYNTAERFDPESHRFLLITKSHGSKEVAVAPHLSVDLRGKTDPEEDREFMESVWKSFLQEESSDVSLGKHGEPILGKHGEPILNDVDERLRDNEDREPVGISKVDYIGLLGHLGDTEGMRFPIVFMQACKSGLEYSQDFPWLEEHSDNYKSVNLTNIGRLYTTDREGLGYDEIDYGQLASHQFRSQQFRNAFTDLQDVMRCFLYNFTNEARASDDYQKGSLQTRICPAVQEKRAEN